MDMQKIDELAKKTSFSRRKCEKVLKDKNNNMDEALEYLLKLKQNPMEVVLDNFSANFTGEKGKKFTIYDHEKVFLSFPAIFAVLFLIFFNIASWVFAAAILFIIAFDMNIKIESTSKKKKEDFGIVEVTEYQNIKSNKKTQNSTQTDNPTDYNEITIE